jgi:hypothetical protein
VQCACGKAFAAKDELAGKTVKCPACQQPLKIPGGGAAAAPAAKSAAKPSAPASPAKQAASKPAVAPARPAAAAASAGDLFDEIGLEAAAPDTRPCPGCTEPMPLAAVICIKCGYNTRLGRRMETVRVGSETAAVGHGVVAHDLLNKAAQVMDEDAAEEVKKTKEGLPWWVFLIALCILIGFVTCMLLFYAKEQPDDKKKGFLQPSGSVERALVDSGMRVKLFGV